KPMVPSRSTSNTKSAPAKASPRKRRIWPSSDTRQLLRRGGQAVFEIEEDVHQLAGRGHRHAAGREAETPEADHVLDRAKLLPEGGEHVRRLQQEVAELVRLAFLGERRIGLVIDGQHALDADVDAADLPAD